MNAVVFINGPKNPRALEKFICRTAVKRPHPIGSRRFAAAENDQRPGRANLVIFLLAVMNRTPAQGEGDRRCIAVWRTRERVKRNHRLRVFFICAAETS